MEIHTEESGALYDYFKTLSPALQDAVLSFDLEEAAANIGYANGLGDGQTEELCDEVVLTLLGFGNPGTFAEHLADRTSIPKESAERISERIKTEVFSHVARDLEELYRHTEAQEEKQDNTTDGAERTEAETGNRQTHRPADEKGPPLPPQPHQNAQSILEKKLEEFRKKQGDAETASPEEEARTEKQAEGAAPPPPPRSDDPYREPVE